MKGRGRPYLAPKYRQFLKEVEAYYRAQGSPKIKGTDPLRASIWLFPPHKRSYDVDNRVKPTLDGLTRCGLWIDDRLVRRVEVSGMPPVVGGAILVRIAPFDYQDEKNRALFALTRFPLKKKEPTTPKKETKK
ncbi:MAG: RusA family crossover junction endodeoxyribonuclease [Thermoguttaceae bacterium]|nr:RusA family crossover junction endodeoxyribonuclease [Thermoguttaceae bacterium]